MAGQLAEYLNSYGDVKAALDKVLNQAALDADSPEQLYVVAKAYNDLGMTGSAMLLRSKIGDRIRALVDKAAVVEDVGHLAAALRLLD